MNFNSFYSIKLIAFLGKSINKTISGISGFALHIYYSVLCLEGSVELDFFGSKSFEMICIYIPSFA